MAWWWMLLQQLALIPALALLGQALVGAFNWQRRQENFVYRLLQIVASPVVKPLRLITPKFVLDRHVPVGAFMLLLVAYFMLGFEHRAACRDNLAQPTCERWAKAWSDDGSKR